MRCVVCMDVRTWSVMDGWFVYVRTCWHVWRVLTWDGVPRPKSKVPSHLRSSGMPTIESMKLGLITSHGSQVT